MQQNAYCLEMLQEFQMTDCLPAHTPLPAGTNLSADSNAPLADAGLYCRMVGKIIYLTNTHPCISFVVSRVSRFMQTHRDDHLQATRHIFGYIKHTLDYDIIYSGESVLIYLVSLTLIGLLARLPDVLLVVMYLLLATSSTNIPQKIKMRRTSVNVIITILEVVTSGC